MSTVLRIALAEAPRAVRLAPAETGSAERELAAQLEAARAEGRAEALAGAAHILDDAALAFASELEAVRAALTTSSVELALEIARQILRVELAEGRYDIEAIVRDALAQSGVGRGECTVHVNPADAEALRSVSFRSGTKIEADNEVPRGSVHVTTPKGLLVRDTDDILREIRERIRGEVQS